jgi:hypothetical protein
MNRHTHTQKKKKKNQRNTRRKEETQTKAMCGTGRDKKKKIDQQTNQTTRRVRSGGAHESVCSQPPKGAFLFSADHTRPQRAVKPKTLVTTTEDEEGD